MASFSIHELYDRLINLTKQRFMVIIFLFALSLFTWFSPEIWFYGADYSSLQGSERLIAFVIRLIFRILFGATSILIVMRSIQLFYERISKVKRLDELKKTVSQLEGLLKDRCLTADISFNKEDCAKWANSVEVLLKDNSDQYNEWVVHTTTMLQTNDLFDGMGYLISRMRNILDLAIKEIKEEINNKKKKPT